MSSNGILESSSKESAICSHNNSVLIHILGDISLSPICNLRGKIWKLYVLAIASSLSGISHQMRFASCLHHARKAYCLLAPKRLEWMVAWWDMTKEKTEQETHSIDTEQQQNRKLLRLMTGSPWSWTVRYGSQWTEGFWTFLTRSSYLVLNSTSSISIPR